MHIEKIPPYQIAIVCLAMAWLGHGFIPEKVHFNYDHHGLGLLVLAVGLAVKLWTRVLTRRVPALQGEGSRGFLTSGPFEWSRNPGYLGVTLILAGVAFYFGSLVMFFAPFAFFMTANRVFIPLEEAVLEKIHGEHYLEYKNRVSRWISLVP